jgi:phosphoribosylaminoimidazole-succinocarboxamide synthase
MARGKYKASAEKRIEFDTIQQLTRKVKELTEENEKLKQQAIQDSHHHAYQIAEMYEQTTAVTSPRIQELEEEVLKLKKALRGIEN